MSCSGMVSLAHTRSRVHPSSLEKKISADKIIQNILKISIYLKVAVYLLG